MLLPIAFTVLTVGAVAWLILMGVRLASSRGPDLIAGIGALRQRIVSDPLDYIRGWVVRTQPARTRLEHLTDAARARVTAADARIKRILTAFKDGAEPSHRFAFFVIAMLVIWVIAVTAAAIIDMPIITALNAGKGELGFLGTLLLLCIPAVGSLLLGELIMRRRALPFAVLSLAVIGIVAAIAIAVGMLTSLAYVRAQVEYAEPIATSEQALAAARIDGDAGQIGFAEDALATLLEEQQRSTEWNTAQVPLAAVAEFASGIFVPLAIPVLQLSDAKRARRKAQSDVERAQRAQQRLGLRQQARLSRFFGWLGIRQVELRDQLAIATAPTPADPPAQGTTDEPDVQPGTPPGPGPIPLAEDSGDDPDVRFDAA
ncbi:hypothetical protein BH11ACT4_BH11ACT4_13090 [soil metagenome]